MSIVLTPQPKPLTVKEAPRIGAPVNELVAFCPNCKTLETLWFSADKLMKTRKFIQVNSHIYHDCGSTEPCRLYRTF